MTPDKEWLKANDYIYLISYAPVSQTRVVVHLGNTYFKPQGQITFFCLMYFCFYVLPFRPPPSSNNKHASGPAGIWSMVRRHEDGQGVGWGDVWSQIDGNNSEI